MKPLYINEVRIYRGGQEEKSRIIINMDFIKNIDPFRFDKTVNDYIWSSITFQDNKNIIVDMDILTLHNHIKVTLNALSRSYRRY